MNQGCKRPHSRATVFSACRLICLAALLGCGAIAWAQSASSGTVSGQVTDQQGALLVGAEVRLTDQQTNITRRTLTNDAGRFSFIGVNPSVYVIVVDKQGFSQSRISTQKVEVGLTMTIIFSLQLGSISTTVEVKAAAGAELQVMNSTI